MYLQKLKNSKERRNQFKVDMENKNIKREKRGRINILTEKDKNYNFYIELKMDIQDEGLD